MGASKVSLQRARGSELLISDTSEMSSEGAAHSWEFMNAVPVQPSSLAAENAQTTGAGLLGAGLLSNVVWFSSNERY